MAKTPKTVHPGEGAKVEVKVVLDGQRIEAEDFKISTLTVSRIINRIPTAKLTILDGDSSDQTFSILDDELFIPGKEIEILVGYDAADQRIFKGIITAFSTHIRSNGSPLLKVECKHPAFKMTLNRNSRYFSDMPDSKIMEEILLAYEAKYFSSEIEDTKANLARMVQYNATDWHFLLARAEANGQMVMVNDEVIEIRVPDTTVAPTFLFEYGEGKSLQEFDALADARYQFKSIEVKSWDPSSQEISVIESKELDIKETGNIPSKEFSKTAGLDHFTLQHGGVLKDDELQAWADAKLQRSRLAKINGRVRSAGTTQIDLGDMIELKGVGKRLNGKVLVSGQVHSVREGNWTLDIQFGLPSEAIGQRGTTTAPDASLLVPGIRGLQVAVVEKLEDPEGEDRILVRLPMISLRDEGIWARMASLDAGENRGFFFRPEIGDEVIVGFLNDDPRDAIVLGMLNSSAKPAPFQAKDDNHEKGFVSRSEIKLTINDDKKSVQLETPGGRQFLLDDDKGVASIKDQNGNKIVMDSNGISIESRGNIMVKANGDLIEEALKNLEVKAGARYKAEGQAGAEVSTSAEAILKGSLVRIN